MTASNPPPAPSEASGKTVQEYIDETPVWADATPVRYASLTNMQWLIWGLAAAGKFFEGMVVFTTGVALPLMAKEFDLDATGKGIVAAASLFGILIGATALGGLADRYGRKQMFIVEMVLFAIFIVMLTFSPSYVLIVIALVGVGIALGCDYPTAHLIISESMPSRIRGGLVLGAFGFQAVGALAGTAIGFLILYENPEVGAWRWIYASTIIIAAPVIVGRFFVVQSPSWLMVRGRVAEAAAETERLLLREPRYPKSIVLRDPRESGHWRHPKAADWIALFRGRNLRRTILASVPWFLQDLGDPRSGGGLCGVIRQDRRGHDCVPVSDPAQGHRHLSSAADPGGDEPARRPRHQALRVRDHGDEPGEDGRATFLSRPRTAAYGLGISAISRPKPLTGWRTLRWRWISQHCAGIAWMTGTPRSCSSISMMSSVRQAGPSM
jgi:MFS family permease